MMLISRALTKADRLIDTDTKLTASEASALAAAGVTAIVRYVFFGPPPKGDLDAGELDTLLTAGHTVLVIQHPPYLNWYADGETGRNHAETAIANAIAAGYQTPAGYRPLSFGIDMEGVKPGSNPAAYAAQSCIARAASGYSPLVYVGDESGLRAQDLDTLPCSPTFWRDFAAVAARPEPAKGYALQQRLNKLGICGVSVDDDEVIQEGVVVGLAYG